MKTLFHTIENLFEAFNNMKWRINYVYPIFETTDFLPLNLRATLKMRLYETFSFTNYLLYVYIIVLKDNIIALLPVRKE